MQPNVTEFNVRFTEDTFDIDEERPQRMLPRRKRQVFEPHRPESVSESESDTRVNRVFNKKLNVQTEEWEDQ